MNRLKKSRSWILNVASRREMGLVAAGGQMHPFFANTTMLTSFHWSGMKVVFSEALKSGFFPNHVGYIPCASHENFFFFFAFITFNITWCVTMGIISPLFIPT